jgi:hypothetical protein
MGAIFFWSRRGKSVHHPLGFEEVCSCLVIRGMSHGTLKWKLFPFSLMRIAKKWYAQTIIGVKGD